MDCFSNLMVHLLSFKSKLLLQYFKKYLGIYLSGTCPKGMTFLLLNLQSIQFLPLLLSAPKFYFEFMIVNCFYLLFLFLYLFNFVIFYYYFFYFRLHNMMIFHFLFTVFPFWNNIKIYYLFA